ncbi:MAG: hypothetical protein WC763_04840 [Candidatus Paceibacterota bacterium]
MSRRKQSLTQNEPLTKDDVENIVTRVIVTIVPPIVTAIMEKIVDERLDKFAIMVKRSFDDINERMVTKDEFNEFKGDTEQALYYLQSDVTDLKGRMSKVENRLDGVESATKTMVSMWHDHETRIVVLEN